MARSVTHTAVRPALSFDIEPSAAVNSCRCDHPCGPPDEQAGGVDLHLHVGEHEGDRLVLDDKLAELAALLGVPRGRTRRRRRG